MGMGLCCQAVYTGWRRSTAYGARSGGLRQEENVRIQEENFHVRETGVLLGGAEILPKLLHSSRSVRRPGRRASCLSSLCQQNCGSGNCRWQSHLAMRGRRKLRPQALPEDSELGKGLRSRGAPRAPHSLAHTPREALLSLHARCAQTKSRCYFLSRG